ncbi:hypothetical protein EGW08_009186, partial [Elysia chlorotica]
MARSKTKRTTHEVEEDHTIESESNDDSSDEAEERLSDTGFEAEDEKNDSLGEDKSGMASVVARILSKDVSKSNRVLLARGKTDKEILSDISKRKRQREKDNPDIGTDESHPGISRKEYLIKEEKRKLWESMGRKIPSVLDNPKEAKLRKLATQGMVQLFRSVNEHQKVMRDRLSTVGTSEIKKDKVMAGFTKGKFLDLLKGKNGSEQKLQDDHNDGGKWKILQDDYMMGASMKDWDKEGSDGDQSTDDSDPNEPMDEDGDQ